MTAQSDLRDAIAGALQDLTWAGQELSSAHARALADRVVAMPQLGPLAAGRDMTEIDAAKIAQQKGNADEKKFAEMMVADHTKTSTELKSMVPDNMKVAIPTVLDDASQKKIAKLRDAKPG